MLDLRSGHLAHLRVRNAISRSLVPEAKVGQFVKHDEAAMWVAALHSDEDAFAHGYFVVG